MDTAMVPGVLYFVAGYNEGERTAATSGQTDSDSAASGSDASAETDEGNDSTGGAEESANGDAAGPQVEIGRMAGYFTIPVEEVLVACQSSPDRRLGDVLNEEGQRQGAGSSTESASEPEATDADGSNADTPSSQ